MITLSALVPRFTDATSWYRAAGPLGAIARMCPRLHIEFRENWSWSTLAGTRAVFLQRPYTDNHRHIAAMAKEAGCKIWVDYDDLLFDIPTDNPTYFQYMNQKTMSTVKWIIEQADVVTVSSLELKRQLDQFNKDVRVVPNALDDRLLHFRRDLPRAKLISWRGSPTHHKDVFLYTPAILEVANSQYASEWKWNFIGDTLWFLTDRMPHTRTYITKGMEIVEYHEHLCGQAPTAMLVPLHDSIFNKCKSNIAWIEASLAGAVCIGPDWQEWQRPGMITYSSRDHLRDVLRQLVKGDMDTARLAKLSWEYIESELMLTKVNQARMQVICEILGCDEEYLRR